MVGPHPRISQMLCLFPAVVGEYFHRFLVLLEQLEEAIVVDCEELHLHCGFREVERLEFVFFEVNFPRASLVNLLLDGSFLWNAAFEFVLR